MKRKSFLKTIGLGSAALMTSPIPSGAASPSIKADPAFQLGLASYTFRKFSLDQTIGFAQRLGLKNIALKSMHLPLDASVEEIKAAAAKVREAGLNLYGAGVVYMKTADEVNQAFDYAKNAGMKMIIGVPNHELLPLVNEKVKQLDIILAIHNHGPGDDLYSSPTDVYEKVKSLDKRVGLCMDIGHVVRIEQDPVALAQKYKDRLYDFHLKDVNKSAADGTPVEAGRGVIDLPAFIKAMMKINYSGNLSFEYEKDESDPLPGLAESVGYIRGIVASL